MSGDAAPDPPAPALAARDVTRRFGDREALRDVSFAAARRRDARGHRAQRRRQDDAAVDPRRRARADRRARCQPRPARRRLGARSSPRSTASSRSPRTCALFARLERVADPAAVVDRMLEQTGLRDRAGDELGTLSGGNRQRVNIAVGLLADPDVLLLDEPSSSLDPRQRERLWDFVGALARGGTAVVFTTHNVGEAERYADRVLVLADGELLFAGTPDGLHEAVGDDPAHPRDFEAAFVRFLHERGH